MTELQAALRDLPLGGLHFYQTIGSTNDEALAWARQGAGDLSVVAADEQTAGRGRAGRRWLTPPGAALAFSLILRPTAAEGAHVTRMAGLAALAVTAACARLGLRPEIKWPNDVLLGGRKAAGILVETTWAGSAPEVCILGVGINALRSSVPPAGQLLFPATSIEDALGRQPERAALLHDCLAALLAWRARLGSAEFLEEWDRQLAFRGKLVEAGADGSPAVRGELVGLEADGSLRIREAGGQLHLVHSGEIHLRPVV